jgi:hypothetical protein
MSHDLTTTSRARHPSLCRGQASAATGRVAVQEGRYVGTSGATRYSGTLRCTAPGPPATADITWWACSTWCSTPRAGHVMVAEPTRAVDLDPNAAGEELAGGTARGPARGRQAATCPGAGPPAALMRRARVSSGRTRPTVEMLERLADEFNVEMSTHRDTWRPTCRLPPGGTPVSRFLPR